MDLVHGRGRGRSRLAVLCLVLLLGATLAGCGDGAGASDAVAGSLGDAGDLVEVGDEYHTAVVGGTTFLLNATKASLTRLGEPGERDSRLTVDVGDGGVLELLTAADFDALAVLDRRAGLLEWFNLESLIRREVELGRGEWRGALVEEDAAVLVNRTTGELVKANRQGVEATVTVGGKGDELELSLTDEGILVRNLTARTESLRRVSDLSEIRKGDLPGSAEDRLLTGVGTKVPANWLLNLSTGELHGLGVDGGWAGKVRVTDPDTEAGSPVAVGDWVYVLLPSAGSVLVVHAADGKAEGRVEVGRRPSLMLTPDGDSVTVASVPTGYAARLKGTKLDVVRDPSQTAVLSAGVQGGPSGGGSGTSGSPSTPGSGTGGSTATSRGSTTGPTNPSTGPTNPGPTNPTTGPTSRTNPTTGPTNQTTGPTSQTNPTTGPTVLPDFNVSGVAVGLVSETYIDVSWTLTDPGGRVRKITVNWGTGGSFVSRVLLDPVSGSYRITGLQPATTYAVDVAADPFSGSSKLGNRVSATTKTPPPTPPPTVLHSAPYSVSAVVVSGTAIDVSWALDNPSGTLSRITVNWGTSAGFVDRAVLGPDARSHRIEGLVPGTAYSVDVVAIGLDEAAQRGATAFATTPAPPPPSVITGPYAQTIAAGPTFLDLSWSLDDPGGRVQSITVNVGGGGGFNRQVLAASARAYRFEGLAPGTAYEVNIVAVVSPAENYIGPLLTATTTS